MSKLSFVFHTTIISIISSFLYRVFLFKAIPSLSYAISKVFFYTLLIFLTFFLSALTFERRRSLSCVISNVVIPVGIYHLMSYWTELTVLSVCFLVVGMVLSVLYFILLLSRKINNQKKKRIIINNRIKNALFGTKTLISLSLLLVLLQFAANIIFSDSIIPTSVQASTEQNISQYTIANNIDVVMNLDENTWSELSTAEKMDTLQTIANIEKNYLGIQKKELSVVLDSLGENTLACYNNHSQKIKISIDHLSSCTAHEALRSLCHEAYHAYQYSLVELYNTVDPDYKQLLIFEKTKKYTSEFMSYCSGDDDFHTYFTQEVEKSAREYSNWAVLDYFSRIEGQSSQE